ncbi:hypothetical protein M2262_000953 [Pseudomonas sp. BIGb0408]|uniref:Uncharacterized protein n=1 Tax=Phytopseudomonas flavescens TaxID=29435 RepID=A0A7Z0BRT7_9GAMM|nr:hypothetical protein [Pseudomonas sp. BIGb0408]NYH74526.1 hypothetical protein [Pseudomonas flavescens]
MARSHNSVGWVTPYPSTGTAVTWWMKKASSTLRRPCLANRLLTCGSVAMRANRGRGPLPQFRGVDNALSIHRSRDRLVDEKSVIHPTAPTTRESPTHLWERRHARDSRAWPVPTIPAGWITPYPSTGAEIAWWMKKASSTLRRPCFANRLLTCGSVAMRANRGHGPLPRFNAARRSRAERGNDEAGSRTRSTSSRRRPRSRRSR